MKYTIHILIIFCFIQTVFGQKEGNIWYFGDKAGLDFNSSIPKPLTDGALYTKEGCATICDKNGNLLFYTDGTYVWNKNHIQMPNGFDLKGNASSSQSAVIVPFPLDSAKYYIFTVDAFAGPNGMQYYIVDMNKDSGRGDIIVKNKQLDTLVCEKLTAVQHSNKTDIWVIAHLWESNKFVAYLVTKNGINKPVYSAVGAYHGGWAANSIGYLKASPDGKRLASVRWTTGGECQLYDFDNKTGLIKNPILIKARNGYGVEFSSDSKLLYVVHEGHRLNLGQIYQYFLDTNDTAQIAKSGFLVADKIESTGALQLGPDKKIYITQEGSLYLHVIENPNKIGSACSFKLNAVPLDGKISALGLPTFIQSFFEISATFTAYNFCTNEATVFKGSSALSIDSWEWDFGDPASGVKNTSNLKECEHEFNAPGNYNVKLTVSANGFTEIIEKKVRIYQKPVADLGPEKAICITSPVTLSGGEAESYKWSTGETTKQITVNKTGLYWLMLKNGLCSVTDTINVTYLVEKNLWLGNDTIICEGQELTLSNNTQAASYLWNTGSSQAELKVNKSGKYWLATSFANCVNTDTINITVLPYPEINLGTDKTICDTKSISLSGGEAESYYWSTGEITKEITVNKTGTYWLMLKNGLCTSSDTIQIIYINEKDYRLGDDITICEGQEIILGNDIYDGKYLWNTGSTEPQLNINKSGEYWRRTIVNGCIKHDTINIIVLPVPDVELGQNVALCEGDEIELNAGNPGAQLLWNTGEISQKIKVRSAGKYWVNITAGNCSVSDTIVMDICPPVIYIPNAFSPNMDGINDTFKIICSDVASTNLQIFNRWGECILESFDLRKGWDGKWKNANCPNDTYLYIFSYRSSLQPNAVFKQMKGTVNLLR